MNRKLSLPVCTTIICLMLLTACTSTPKVTDEEVRLEYDRLVAESWSGNEYEVRHILLQRQEEALVALKRIQGGEPFAQVAKAVSIDTGTRNRGGDLGWRLPAMFVPEFARAMVALSPKGLTSMPVQSPFGWHVIEVLDIRKAVTPPFDRVKENIANRLQKSKAGQ